MFRIIALAQGLVLGIKCALLHRQCDHWGQARRDSVVAGHRDARGRQPCLDFISSEVFGAILDDSHERVHVEESGRLRDALVLEEIHTLQAPAQPFEVAIEYGACHHIAVADPDRVQADSGRRILSLGDYIDVSMQESMMTLIPVQVQGVRLIGNAPIALFGWPATSQHFDLTAALHRLVDWRMIRATLALAINHQPELPCFVRHRPSPMRACWRAACSLASTSSCRAL